MKRKTKILLVDDRKENLHALDSLLRDEHTEIFKASSGREALGFLLDHEFAVALLDVEMPEINGFELAELMRGSDQTKKIPIIFVTAGAIDPRHTFRGYEAGAVDFLYKPLDPRIVRGKVQVFIQLEEQRLQINDQLREVEAALQMREEFLSIASHELKTPLTSLSLQFQLARRAVNIEKGTTPSPEKLAKTLDLANKQITRLNHMINELLDISRIQAGKLTIQLSPVELHALAQEIVERMAPELEQAHCEVEMHLSSPVIIPGDSFRIEQVIVNLVSNVIKYAASSRLIVSVTKDSKFGILSIRDTGPGIPEDKIDTVFERFERVTKDKGISGLGLGLYIVKQIMNLHTGEISVLSKIGKGTEFIAKFPLESK